LGDPPTAAVAEQALREGAALVTLRGHNPQPTHNESIPKTEAVIQKAVGDGSCLFYCMLGENDWVKAQMLRAQLAQFVHMHAQSQIGHMTVRQAIEQRGMTVQSYMQNIVLPSTYGGELELLFIAAMQQKQVRVFMDKEGNWGEVAHFGTAGELVRLLFTPRTRVTQPHYDILQMKERWAVQMAQQAAEEEHRKVSTRGVERAPIKSTEQRSRERGEAKAQQYMQRTKEGRKAKAQESRDRTAAERVQEDDEEGEAEGASDDQETPQLLMEVSGVREAQYCVCRRPYNAKEYYIQCTGCQGWFHPRCLGTTRAECEARRQTGGWVCGQVECANEGEREPTKEKTE
jgi:hypothetical protein